MNIRVRVAGWSTPRAIFEKDGRILFEVAEDDGCRICQGRIEHVRRTLNGKDIPVEFRVMSSDYGDRCFYVVLDMPPEGVDVRQHVAQLLNLSIS